jgi:hypothetical protein
MSLMSNHASRARHSNVNSPESNSESPGRDDVASVTLQSSGRLPSGQPDCAENLKQRRGMGGERDSERA